MRLIRVCASCVSTEDSVDQTHPIFKPTMYVLFWFLLLLLALIVVYKFDIATHVQAFVVMDDGPTESTEVGEEPQPQKHHRATIDKAASRATKRETSFDPRRAQSDSRSLSIDFTGLDARMSHRSRVSDRGGRDLKNRSSVTSITFGERSESSRPKMTPYKSAILRRSKQGPYPERPRNRKSVNQRQKRKPNIPVQRESLTDHFSSIIMGHNRAMDRSSSINTAQDDE